MTRDMDINTQEKFGIRSTQILPMDGVNDSLDGVIFVVGGQIVDIREIDDCGDLDDWLIHDVGDRSVLPGFVDPHMHLQLASNALYGAVDCHVPPCSSIEDMVGALYESKHLSDARGGWLLGMGGLFSDRRFSECRMPTRHDLDKVSKRIPIAVRLGGHVTVLNTRGLELAFENGLPELGNSKIVRDEDGTPNGILHELHHALPIPDRSADELSDAFTQTTRDYVTRYGVTTFGEISNTRRELGHFAQCIESGAIPQQVELYVSAPMTADFQTALEAREWPELGSVDKRLRVRGIKIFSDGGFSAAGAAILKPYANSHDGSSGHKGRLRYTREELIELLRSAADRDMQVAAHVNGERAQRQICEAAASLKEERSLPALRLEHAGNYVSDWQTPDYWKQAEASIVPQAPFIWTMGGYMPEYLGASSDKSLFPFRELLDRGFRLASSSDASGSENLQFNPLFGVQCAMTRVSAAGHIVNPGQELTLFESLLMNTLYAAEALGVDDTVGSLEVGKQADIIVASTDLTKVAAEKISEVSIDRVIIRGRQVA